MPSTAAVTMLNAAAAASAHQVERTERSLHHSDDTTSRACTTAPPAGWRAVPVSCGTVKVSTAASPRRRGDRDCAAVVRGVFGEFHIAFLQGCLLSGQLGQGEAADPG